MKKELPIVEIVCIVILTPIVVNGMLTVINYTARGINKLSFKRRMKKGIKKGEIVEINGNYYTVEIED